MLLAVLAAAFLILLCIFSLAVTLRRYLHLLEEVSERLRRHEANFANLHTRFVAFERSLESHLCGFDDRLSLLHAVARPHGAHIVKTPRRPVDDGSGTAA